MKHINEFEAVPIITDDVDVVLASTGSLQSVPVNLAKYAVGRKVAMPAKPCDAEAVIKQAKRNMVELDNTYIVGLNCGGSMHPVTTKKMLVEMYDIDPEDVVGEDIEKGKLIFRTKNGEEKAIAIDELEEAGFGRRESCRFCTLKIPVNADLACDNWGVIGDLAGSATFCQVMNDVGVKLLENAIEAGRVEVQPASDKAIAIDNGIMLDNHRKVSQLVIKFGHAVPINDEAEEKRKDVGLDDTPPTVHSSRTHWARFRN